MVSTWPESRNEPTLNSDGNNASQVPPGTPDSDSPKLGSSIPVNPAYSTTLFVGIIVLAQAGFWFYSMPWPQIQEPQNLKTACMSCFIAAMVLLVIPLLIARVVFRRGFFELGLGPGDFQFGWRAIFWCAPAMVIGTWIGSGDAQIKAFYPLPGDSIGDSAADMVVWFSVYFLYYVAFEFFYRGFMLRGLQQFDSTRYMWRLIAIQAILCFLIHIGKPNAELIASLPASVLFGWIAWRSRSIWYGLAIHFLVGVVNDLAAM